MNYIGPTSVVISMIYIRYKIDICRQILAHASSSLRLHKINGLF